MTRPRRRDKDAFEALYDRTAERLLVSITRRVQDAEIAGEVWAECWAAAFAGWPACRADGADEEDAWVFGIARRRVADYWRSGAVRSRALERLRWTVPIAAPGEDEQLMRTVELRELHDSLKDALTALPERRRNAVLLRVVEGRSYPEVAARMGCSEDAARAHVSRGLRALQGYLDPPSAPSQPQGA